MQLDPPDPVDPSSASEPTRAPRFFVVAQPDGRYEVHDDDVHHALHVHRLGPGDALWGLDGEGGARFLRVVRTGRRSLVLEDEDRVAPQTQALPGRSGSSLPYVDLAVSLPKSNRMEEFLQRLTQLGVARLQPILCRYTPPGAREEHAKRLSKWERFVREAMKQCGRLWPLEIAAPLTLDQWWQAAPAEPTLLHHEAPRLWWSVLQEKSAIAPLPRQVCLGIGPEGGFTNEEREGRAAARLAGYVLRTETAAEMAAGCTLQAWSQDP